MEKKFYQLSAKERLEKVQVDLGLDDLTIEDLSLETAEQMIENVVGLYSLPLGLATNFVVNGRQYYVPMAVEEPSVVAAASNGAKRLGNIEVKVLNRELIGQIVILSEFGDSAATKLLDHYDQLMETAKAHSANMVKRGGGPTYFRVERSFNTSFTTLYLMFDPCEAMGANALNTALEAMARQIETELGLDVLMSILSNDGSRMLVEAEANVPLESLSRNEATARRMAERIALAGQYADEDPKRAVTHNKGIMNGIDAVALATGNDWRAMEASFHQYARGPVDYVSLTEWKISDCGQYLNGRIRLPLPVATVGGTLSIHPTAQWSLKVLGNPTARELAEIMAAVGLAQNFAALLALTTSGIQKGHMGLQARSLAVQVGAEGEEVAAVAARLRQKGPINRDRASELLQELRQEGRD